MFREFLLISALVLSSLGQFHNEQPFERTQVFDLENMSAEMLSPNTYGNRLLVSGGKSGILSILDTNNLDDVQVLGRIDFNNEVEHIAKLAVNEKLVDGDGRKMLQKLFTNVTDVKYLTGGRYSVATISIYSDELERHPLLQVGALAFIDMESFGIKSIHLTDPNPECIATSYDHEYILVACQGYEDLFQRSLSITGSVMRYDLVGANIEFAGRFDFDDNVECDFRMMSGCILKNPRLSIDHIAASPTENIAAATDQNCNALLLLDIHELKIYQIIDMGIGKHLADIRSNDTIEFSFIEDLRREPDGVIFDKTGHFIITANEGTPSSLNEQFDLHSGGRSITILDRAGNRIYDSLSRTEYNEAISGQYKDKHSASHGSQLENLAIGSIDDKDYLAVTAEKSSVVHFFDVSDMTNVVYLGHIPTGGKAPEGIVYIPVHESFVSANEKSGSISVFKFTREKNNE